MSPKQTTGELPTILFQTIPAEGSNPDGTKFTEIMRTHLKKSTNELPQTELTRFPSTGNIISAPLPAIEYNLYRGNANVKYTVKISDNRVKYSFELVRNFTIVQDNSGTGKTTLFDMIAAYARLKEKSSVQLVCDKPCVALRPDSDWQHTLKNTEDSIVFIDEESDYIRKQEFAAAIKRTDNYYVIFTRENLHNLPYSVEKIYKIHTSGKLHTFRKLYTQQSDYSYSLRTGQKNSVFSFPHRGFQKRLFVLCELL